ncbi:hypothetical protein GQ42DRAFT_85692 [Ramicandelaber brevisporus]|nr:hypothetical protein GQ42DRAFT_85692 [Ramicandelaber brevisporus]
MIASSKSSTIHALAVPLMTSTCTMNTPPATSMTWAATVMLCNGVHSRLNRTWSGSTTSSSQRQQPSSSTTSPHSRTVNATSRSHINKNCSRSSTPMTPTVPRIPKTTCLTPRKLTLIMTT